MTWICNARARALYVYVYVHVPVHVCVCAHAYRRVFGSMACLVGVGAIVANLAASRLYQTSLEEPLGLCPCLFSVCLWLCLHPGLSQCVCGFSLCSLVRLLNAKLPLTIPVPVSITFPVSVPVLCPCLYLITCQDAECSLSLLSVLGSGGALPLMLVGVLLYSIAFIGMISMCSQ